MNDQIVALARACIDTPFKHQGRLPCVALDCAGLAVHILNELRLPLIDLKGYGRTPNDGTLKRIMDMQPCLKQIDRMASEAGDFLLIRTGREPSHIAVQSESDCIIHAYEPVGKTCEHRLDDNWRLNIVAAYKIVSPE
jgi:hypothetical protein